MINYKPKYIILIILLFILACQSHKNGDNNFFIEHPANKNIQGDIIFVSDTQEPIWAETLIMEKNHNGQAREMIFNEILKRKPDKVIHLGDIVALGFKEQEWQPIDTFLHKLISEGSEFYPTLGNHELLFFPETGKKNFMRRFPFYSPTGYLVNDGPIKIILLNSNFSNLSKQEIEKQQQWYHSTLKQLQQDSTVKAIIVGCHHAPFTNSKMVSPNKDVQKLFVPAFTEAPKCKLFISGHAHAFERFKYTGKDFLVIGGGGGLQQTLYTGDEEKYKDLYDSQSKKRMFHFIQCRLENDSLKIVLNMIKKDFSGFDRHYKIKIPVN